MMTSTAFRPSSAAGIRRRDGATGFTLAELLVAMTLLGLISVALFGGLRFGTKAWEAGIQRADSFSDVEVVQSLLRRQLDRAVSFPVADQKVSFAGAEERLQFSAPAASQFGPAGFYRFELLAVSDVGRKDLVMRWRVERFDLEESDIEATERILLENIAALEFAYYGDPERSRDHDWQDEWEEADLPPGLISVKIVFPDGDDRVWPELIAAPRLGHNDLL